MLDYTTTIRFLDRINEIEWEVECSTKKVSPDPTKDIIVETAEVVAGCKCDAEKRIGANNPLACSVDYIWAHKKGCPGTIGRIQGTEFVKRLTVTQLTDLLFDAGEKFEAAMDARHDQESTMEYADVDLDGDTTPEDDP